MKSLRVVPPSLAAAMTLLVLAPLFLFGQTTNATPYQSVLTERQHNASHHPELYQHHQDDGMMDLNSQESTTVIRGSSYPVVDFLPFASVELLRWTPPSSFNPEVLTQVHSGNNNNRKHDNDNEDNDNNTPVKQQEQQQHQQQQSRRRLQETDTSLSGMKTVPTTPGENLIVVVTFRDIYKVILFIAVAWFLGTLSVYIGLPSLVGEIAAGFLLGPPLADLVPYPGALVLTGNIGLIGLILESGIALDVAQLREVGHRALLLAIVGSALPLLTGFGVGRWIGKDIKSAIAVGAAFAPSSLGVASNALSSGDVLNTPIGQMIVASSVFDDVFGLILLSILEVFADENPTTFQYILPFLASFGYLIVLGLLGITVLPRLLETKIIPMVAEDKREQFAMVLLMIFTVGYMLMLNYSGSSYLTGVFLAGLTFSQLHGVHASFVKQGKPLLNWLLRIFFAATIGFQVPITRFKDPYVVKWGFALLLPVFAKVPIGLLVPHFSKEKADDFPYNPYLRDVFVTSLAMTCRGEFNVIVASYALSEGLFHPDTYSAVIFAILFGSIVSPLLLSKLLQYYNDLTTDYLEGQHPIERIGNTCDGYRPLFLAIQARTPVRWNLQEAFKRKLEEDHLVIIDHRSWHTLGRQDIGEEAVDVTELFVQDSQMKVRVAGAFGRRQDDSERSSNDSARLSDKGSLEITENTGTEPNSPETSVGCEEGMKEEEQVEARCEEIKRVLSECLKGEDPNDYIIQVSQWQAFIVDKTSTSGKGKDATNRSRFYSFHADLMEGDEVEAETQQNEEEEPTKKSFFHRRNSSSGTSGHRRTNSSGASAHHRRSKSFLSIGGLSDAHTEDGPQLAREDLWETDNTCHDACREGYTLTPDCHGHGTTNITAGLGGSDTVRPSPRHRHTRTASFDFSILTSQALSDREKETSVIRDRLCGYVRHHEILPSSHPEACSLVQEPLAPLEE